MSAPARTLPLALYAAATALLQPLAPRVLRARAKAGKEDVGRLAERLGRAGAPRPPGPLVWLHGVSVGESLSLLPFVDALRSHRPDLVLLVTSGTVTSAQLLAQRLPPGVIHQYAPVDSPRAVRRFLDYWRPAVGLLVESELWPNLILGARRRGVRLALLSARITEASAKGWGRAPASARALLSAFDLVMPQDAATATRLERLGATVGPFLNLKLAADAPPADEAELAKLRQAIGARPVVLAASTHSGEELLIAQAAPEALLVMAPRHPGRGAEVADLLRGAGLSVARRSAGELPGPDIQAYVADTLGEMGIFLRLADVAVMGGAFVEGVGGHNPLEAARLGKPVITGPHAFNARDIYAEMFAAAAAMEAADGQMLARHLAGLLANPVIARRVGEAGVAYAARQGAQLTGALALIEGLIPE